MVLVNLTLPSFKTRIAWKVNFWRTTRILNFFFISYNMYLKNFKTFFVKISNALYEDHLGGHFTSRLTLWMKIYFLILTFKTQMYPFNFQAKTINFCYLIDKLNYQFWNYQIVSYLNCIKYITLFARFFRRNRSTSFYSNRNPILMTFLSNSSTWSVQDKLESKVSPKYLNFLKVSLGSCFFFSRKGNIRIASHGIDMHDFCFGRFKFQSNGLEIVPNTGSF